MSDFFRTLAQIHIKRAQLQGLSADGSFLFLVVPDRMPDLSRAQWRGLQQKFCSPESSSQLSWPEANLYSEPRTVISLTLAIPYFMKSSLLMDHFYMVFIRNLEVLHTNHSLY